MRRFAWPRSEGFAQAGSVRVRVVYDGEIALATGKEEDSSWVSDGAPFVFMINAIITEYPEVAKRFEPGEVVFTVNGRIPEPMTAIHNGDEIRVFVPRKGVVAESTA